MLSHDVLMNAAWRVNFTQRLGAVVEVVSKDQSGIPDHSASMIL
jgi:hypothetical protein